MRGRQRLDQPYGIYLEESCMCMHESIADLLYDNGTELKSTLLLRPIHPYSLCRMCLKSSPSQGPHNPIPSPAAVPLSNPHHQSISQPTKALLSLSTPKYPLFMSRSTSSHHPIISSDPIILGGMASLRGHADRSSLLGGLAGNDVGLRDGGLNDGAFFRGEGVGEGGIELGLFGLEF